MHVLDRGLHSVRDENGGVTDIAVHRDGQASGAVSQHRIFTPGVYVSACSDLCLSKK